MQRSHRGACLPGVPGLSPAQRCEGDNPCFLHQHSQYHRIGHNSANLFSKHRIWNYMKILNKNGGGGGS